MLKGRKTDNFSMRIYLDTIESIVGHHGLRSVLNYAHLEKYIDNFPPLNNHVEIPLEDLQNLCRSLLELFGKKGIRSLQLRVGRLIIDRSLKKLPIPIKIAVLVRFLYPKHAKMKIALEKLMESFERRYPVEDDISQGPRLSLKEEEDCFIISVRENWESDDIMSVSPVCHITVGAIGAFVKWATKHAHEVKEIECRAMGHPADVFKISKSYTEE